jgi:hypothetical protein
MLINTVLNAQGACFLNYIRSSNKLYLANDNFTVWLGPVTPGSPGSAQNSQCSIDGATSSVSGAGNTLTINAALTFKSAFAGTKVNYVVAHDNGGLNSGWQVPGGWTVPAPFKP